MHLLGCSVYSYLVRRIFRKCKLKSTCLSNTALHEGKPSNVPANFDNPIYGDEQNSTGHGYSEVDIKSVSKNGTDTSGSNQVFDNAIYDNDLTKNIYSQPVRINSKGGMNNSGNSTVQPAQPDQLYSVVNKAHAKSLAKTHQESTNSVKYAILDGPSNNNAVHSPDDDYDVPHLPNETYDVPHQPIGPYDVTYPSNSPYDVAHPSNGPYDVAHPSNSPYNVAHPPNSSYELVHPSLDAIHDMYSVPDFTPL